MSWRSAAFLVLISWGALSFGAVYPWAFIPLYVGCAALGLAMFLERREAAAMDVPLALSLMLVGIAISVQLVPFHVDTIRRLSPETDLLLQRYVFGYATAIQRHALSIEPDATARALFGAAALAMLFLGSARALTDPDAVQIARGVGILGAVMALA